MGIWIENQDNRELINAEHILVRGRSIGVVVNGRVNSMGEYETEERALEVLKDIKRTITENEAFKMGIKKSTTNRALVYTHIYKMPEK